MSISVQTGSGFSTAAPYVKTPEVEIAHFPTPVSMTSGMHVTVGNNGRKLVLLDNGWAVLAAQNGTYIQFRVDRNDGNGFVDLCYLQASNWTTAARFAISSGGNTVHFVGASNADVRAVSFDATTQTNINLHSSCTVLEANANIYEIGDPSIATHTDGTTHAVWYCRHATYSNSKNIRYASRSSAGVWGSTVFLTTYNSTTVHCTMPSVDVSVSTGRPAVVWQQTDNVYVTINGKYHTGSAWANCSNAGYITPYSVNYPQKNPCILRGDGNVMMVAWQGTDSTDTTADNIRYAESSDGGATWGSPTKLTTGNTYNQITPTLCRRGDGSKAVVFSGRASGTIDQIRMISYNGSWGSPSNVTSDSAAQYNPTSIARANLLTTPVYAWQDSSALTNKLKGSWMTGGWKPATMYVNTGAGWSQV